MDLNTKAGSAFLFELRGKRVGSEYLLPENGFQIGSDKGNDLVINDRDISSFQVKINFYEGQFFLQNISPLGTAYINGEAFEDVPLKKGDIITLGSSMFRYVAPGETLSQEYLWRPVGGKQDTSKLRGNYIPRKPLIGLVILVVVFIMFIVFSNENEEYYFLNQKKDAQKKTESTRFTERQEIKALYSRGKDLLASRRWDEAVLAFEAIRRKMPSFMDTDTLYQKAIQESGYLDIINQGMGLFMEHNPIEAKTVIKQISERSYYFREKERLMREIENSLMDKRIKTAQKALKEKNWVVSKQEAKTILDQYPNNKEAYRILMEARALQRVFLNDKPDKIDVGSFEKEKRETKVKKAATSAAVLKPAKAKSGPAKGTLAWHMNKGLTAYINGNTNRSLYHFETVIKKSSDKNGTLAKKAVSKLEDLRYAETYYQQAKGLQAVGRYSEAIDLWEKFLEKDRNLTGNRRSVYFKQASIALSTIYYQRGRDEFDKEDFPKAFFYWNMAKQINPKGKGLAAGLDELNELAIKYYREGYSLQEINLEKAMELWKNVLKIVSPKNSYYLKAQKKLEHFAKKK